MASVALLAVFLLSGSFPARAQDTRTDQAGSVLREYVDKGYCTYTYVVPPGSRTEGCTPPGLERQLAETKEETGRLKNQVDRLSSLLETLMSQQSDLTSRVDSLSAELSEEKVRSAQLEQNLTQELQEVETRLQDQCNCERPVPGGDVISTTTATLPRERTATTQPSIPPPARESTGPVTEDDCAGYHSSGVTTSGVYRIGLLPADVEAFCDMDTAGGGWTVIQRRQDGSVPFNRTWEEYKLGFGNKNGEYWLGNENIHLLTNQKNYRLRIELLDWNNESAFAEYSTFRVSGESDGYRLYFSGYSGTAGDSMTLGHSLNRQRFSTVDRDNDAWSSTHCSQQLGQGGWWFAACGNSVLNGRYLGNCGYSCPYRQGVLWAHWRGWRYSLKSVSMKIRP
uniref:Fibrinogen C-terminal domain-containing protein n=1 Tax=Branchiostoma floridae TaxID=7739 RepID=C3ZQ43_BRAFL|eukprot:XP_002589411.1 hypothetical protein BRAFLDRAFT_77854 [Branchiostoma floridae]